MAGQELLNRGWDNRQLVLMEWLILNEEQRAAMGLPLTEAALAEKLGVTDRTLRTWKKLPRFQEAHSKMSMLLLWRRLPRIVSASLTNMERPEGHKERENFFRYTLPAILKASDAGFFDEISQAATSNQLPHESAYNLLSAYSPEQRQGILDFLERASLVEGEASTQDDAQIEDEVTSLEDIADYEKAKALEAQLVSKATPKQNKGATRSYSKRNVKPLR